MELEKLLHASSLRQIATFGEMPAGVMDSESDKKTEVGKREGRPHRSNTDFKYQIGSFFANDSTSTTTYEASETAAKADNNSTTASHTAIMVNGDVSEAENTVEDADNETAGELKGIVKEVGDVVVQGKAETTADQVPSVMPQNSIVSGCTKSSSSKTLFNVTCPDFPPSSTHRHPSSQSRNSQTCSSITGCHAATNSHRSLRSTGRCV
jgi:hypothetical protein